MTEPPTFYIARVGDARVAAQHGSGRVRVAVCGRELEMTAEAARRYRRILTEAIRRAG